MTRILFVLLIALGCPPSAVADDEIAEQAAAWLMLLAQAECRNEGKQWGVSANKLEAICNCATGELHKNLTKEDKQRLLATAMSRTFQNERFGVLSR